MVKTVVFAALILCSAQAFARAHSSLEWWGYAKVTLNPDGRSSVEMIRDRYLKVRITYKNVPSPDRNYLIHDAIINAEGTSPEHNADLRGLVKVELAPTYRVFWSGVVEYVCMVRE